MASSVALAEGGVLVAELAAKTRMSHSEHLLADVDALLRRAHWSVDDLDALAVSVGPGSFTGVRIGVTTARTLAWTLGLPLVGCCSLEVLARNAAGRTGIVAPMFDARKKEVYYAVYRETGDGVEGSFETLLPPRVAPPEKARAALEALVRNGDEPCWILGEGLQAYPEVFTVARTPEFRQGPVGDHRPRAAHLAALAEASLRKSGDVADFRTVEPLYVRRSEAELADAARAKKQQEARDHESA